MAKVVRKVRNPFLRKKTLHLVGLLLLLPVTIYLLQQTFSFFQQADETTHIQIQPNLPVLREGQSATLNIVSTSEKEPISALSFTLLYPDTKIDVNEVDTSQSAFQTAEITDQAPGTISFSVKSANPLLGNNLIAQLKITAKDLFDSQEIIAKDNAQATIIIDGNESVITIPITTVFSADADRYNKKTSFIQTLIDSLVDTIQNIIPGNSST